MNYLIHITSRISLLLALLILMQGCVFTQLLKTERETVRTRAANEFDCHVDEVEVHRIADMDRRVFRALGCGHEEVWRCRNQEDGEYAICSRIEFPKKTRFLRF